VNGSSLAAFIFRSIFSTAFESLNSRITAESISQYESTANLKECPHKRVNVSAFRVHDSSQTGMNTPAETGILNVINLCERRSEPGHPISEVSHSTSVLPFSTLDFGGHKLFLRASILVAFAATKVS
jgi:hypothetical protein